MLWQFRLNENGMIIYLKLNTFADTNILLIENPT
jgi:hypothetical protein